ncbi:Uncharacterised protein [Chromobacterium violaceum]|uniref:Uncharacterized protein n=1 Tax=Chromobacterium violaceum TaxID=536 RepID=A0A447T6E2_CHRVL|nr:Uncharacterised protein [Chromobacterium violaceum]
MLLRSLTSAMSVAPVGLVYREAEPPPEFTRVKLSRAEPAGPVIELRNSFMAGQSGRRILQPWRQGDDRSLVLLDLGWLVDGARLPAFRPEQILAQGYRMPTPHHFVLSGAVRGSEGPSTRWTNRRCGGVTRDTGSRRGGAGELAGAAAPLAGGAGVHARPPLRLRVAMAVAGRLHQRRQLADVEATT